MEPEVTLGEGDYRYDDLEVVRGLKFASAQTVTFCYYVHGVLTVLLPLVCSIERTAYISEKVNSHVFRLLNEYK